MACEVPCPRGGMMTTQLVETIQWIGEFRYILRHLGISMTPIDRVDEKMHLCQFSTAKDTNVRQAIIDRFGGEPAMAGPKCPACNGKGGSGLGKNRVVCPTCCGTKVVKPGCLYGISKDVWAALAVAITYAEEGHLRRQRDDEARMARGLPTKAQEKQLRKEKKKLKKAAEKAAQS